MKLSLPGLLGYFWCCNGQEFFPKNSLDSLQPPREIRIHANSDEMAVSARASPADDCVSMHSVRYYSHNFVEQRGAADSPIPSGSEPAELRSSFHFPHWWAGSSCLFRWRVSLATTNRYFFCEGTGRRWWWRWWKCRRGSARWGGRWWWWWMGDVGSGSPFGSTDQNFSWCRWGRGHESGHLGHERSILVRD